MSVIRTMCRKTEMGLTANVCGRSVVTSHTIILSVPYQKYFVGFLFVTLATTLEAKTLGLIEE